MGSAYGNAGSGQDQAGDDNHRCEGLQRVPPCGAPEIGATKRLYGAHVEAGVGAGVESRVESDDGRPCRPTIVRAQ